MLILVAVTISMAINGGLFENAGRAVGETQNELNKEQQLADGKIQIDGVWYNSIDDYLAVEDEDENAAIPETESYVGYYADVDGDNEPDGISYVDLADTENTSGTWNGNDWSSYAYTPVTEGLKKYKVCKESYTGFGGKWTRPVLTAIEGNEGLKDRFYVMAKDIM